MKLGFEWDENKAKANLKKHSAASPQPKIKPYFTAEAQSSQSSEYFLIKNSLLRVLRGREKK